MTTLSTNFNVSPYFDDYDEDKRFYRILFRPSVAVQARELTQAQTILQKQIERFGNHMFKDGSIVDGVGITYYPTVDYISVEDKFSFANGTQSEVFPTDLDSSYVITNSTDSNNAVRATIKIAKNGIKSDPPNTNRFYLDYIVTGTDTANNDVNIFVPGDTLYIYANTQNRFGNLVSNNLLYTVNTLTTNGTFTSNGQAYCIGVSDGIIFQKGFFTKVEPQIITIKDFSTNVTGYVVGFNTVEEIINENGDLSLTDNALGYTNENAPGAHRLKLIPSLVSKLRTETAENKNFFAIVEFDGQEPTEQKDNPEYNAIEQQMARKTYEESGDYVIKPFQVETRVNSANSQSFFYEVSPGIAYVRGHRIEKIGTTKVEAPRATTTEVAQNQIITANYGNYVICDEFLGVFDTEQLSEIDLYDSPQNAISEYEGTTSTPSGTVVGKANVRAVVFEDGVKGSPTAKYLLYLFNIRMNSGKSFSADVKSLYMSGTFGSAKADIVLENQLAVLKESTRTSSAFETGLFAVKRLTDNTGIGDTSYIYSQTKSGTMTGAGVVTITIDTAAPGASTERLNQTSGSILTGSLLEQYNVYLSSNAYSANLSGTIQLNAGSSIVNSGTSLDTQLTANSLIRIYANTSQTYIRRVVSIESASQMTLDSPLPESNTGSNFQKYFVTGTPLPLANVTINSNTSFSANLGLTLDSGTQTVYCEYPVNRNQATAIPKVINKNRFVKIDCSNNAATTVGPWELGLSDVHNIRHIYVGTTYANTNPNRITWFNLDTGQRDELYDHGKLIIKPEYASNITASTKILVELDHFTPNTTASVGFFSVESYPIDDENTANTNAIQTIEMPQYNSQELRNLIDFRAIKSNTAVSATTEGVATINPVSTANAFSISGTGQYMIIPDSNFTADFEYYLPRYDMLTIDPKGNYNVIQGVPSLNPLFSFIENDQSAIAECFVPAFPTPTKRESDEYNTLSRTRINLKTNRRYTMKDIGGLEERIKRIEYYTVLNVLEQQARDLTVPDANGLDRFKNGIFADPFNNHNLGNVGDFEYKISIDVEQGIARPYYQKHDVDFIFRPTDSTNVQRTGPLITLPYNNERFISQRFATKIRNTTESVWQWNGLINLYPSFDFFRDEEIVPNVNVEIDLASPWEQFAQTPFATMFGDWRDVSSRETRRRIGTERTRQRVFRNGRFAGLLQRTTDLITERTTQNQIIDTLTVGSMNQNIDLGSYVKDIAIQPYLRSRIVAFVAYNMKPKTTLFPFFDDVNVSVHCAPGELSGIEESLEGLEDGIVNQTGDFNDPLVSDDNGFVCGVFRIPAQTFRTGDRIFQLTNVSDLTIGADAKITASKATFTGDNVSVSRGSTTLNVRQPEVSFNRTVNSRVIETTRTEVTEGTWDPISQSFTITGFDTENVGRAVPEAISGIFLSQVGVYFQSKDPNLGITCYIVEMENNFPNDKRIIGKGYLPSSSVLTSTDASIETIFTLEYPVYLLSDNDYAFIIQPDGNSPEYNIWVGETGGFDVATNEQVFSNPYAGIMFISANRKTWTPIQKEDIKFNLYRTRFTQLSGSAVLKNEDDEFISVNGFTRANSSVAIEVGDYVYTVNTSSLPVQNTETIVANTLKNAVSARVQYINEAEGEIWLDSSTANTTTYFSSTINPIIAIYRPPRTAPNIRPNFLAGDTLIAYSNVASVDNLKYHAVVPKIGTLEPSKTSLSYQFKGTSNSNVIDTSFQDVTNNTEYEYFDLERHLMSKSNEITSLSSNKCAEMKINLQSQSSLVSPVINLSKKAMLFVENLINNDANNEHTRYGNAQSKYISKRIVLADGQEAEDLKVYLTAHRPVDSDIKIYAKFWNNQDPQPFEDKIWTELEYANASNLVFTSSVNPDDMVEYEFDVPSINAVPYAAFANTGVDTYNPLSGGISIESSNNTISAKQHSFNANTDVNNSDNTINIADANTYFSVGDEVIYNVDAGNTAITGLTENNKYYVSFSDATQIALSESRTGANIDITAATSVTETGHFFTGTFFTEDFTVGDRIRVESSDYFAIRTITNISNNTSMIVDNGLESTNTGAIYYVFAPGGGDGIVEYENSDGSRFVGYKEVALKIVLLSSNPVRVPRLNDVRMLCLQV